MSKNPGARTGLTHSRTRKRQMLGILFVLPAVVFLAIFVMYPVLYNVYLSFTNANLLKSEISFVALANYKKLFTDPMVRKYFFNTVIWTVFSVIGQLALGLGIALIINKKMRFGTALRSFLLIPYVVPAVTLALVTKWMLNGDYGVISMWLQEAGALAHRQSLLALPATAMAALIIVNIWRSYPFPMLIYWAALKSIDTELYEAAKVDGAGTFRLFWHITLPQLKNTTIVLLVLRIIWTATYFDLIWMVTGGGPAGSTMHLPITIYQASFGTFQTGYASSISVVLGLLLFVCIVFYVKKSGSLDD